MNILILEGNLGSDAVSSTTPRGNLVTKFSLATSEYFTTNGEKKERTTWHKVVVRGENTARYLAANAKKGDAALVQGRVDYYKFTDSAGADRWVYEVSAHTVKLTKKNGSAARSANETIDPQTGEVTTDDEIPF